MERLEPRWLLAFDFGDAPVSYQTFVGDDGARHLTGTELYLGSLIDSEVDGTPSIEANGDDTSGLADEDGVVFPDGPALRAGGLNPVQVTVSAAGFLNAWVDLDADGSWSSGTDEHVIVDQWLEAGTSDLQILVPNWATGTDRTYARFRLDSGGSLEPYGEADDGEVEDYAIAIEHWDFGDAPEEQNYHTLLSNNGARHKLAGSLHLGNGIDVEADGQPTAAADGDDASGADDEDGVTIPTLLVGRTVSVDVDVSSNGLLNAWIDFNADLDWDDPGEKVLDNVPVGEGMQSLPITIPAAAQPGESIARFRVSSISVSYDGPALDGEVEDYLVSIATADFGDAPDVGYQTLFDSGGAYHLLTPNGPQLGTYVDHEEDGQPSADAEGDDGGSGTSYIVKEITYDPDICPCSGSGTVGSPTATSTTPTNGSCATSQSRSRAPICTVSPSPTMHCRATCTLSRGTG